MSQHTNEKADHPYADDEISLKDLILKLQEFWKELWRYWWLIALFCIPFLAYNLYKHITFEKSYAASLTFMVNEDEGGSSLAGMSSVLGSFGLGGATGGEYNLEKMLTLLKSRRTIQEVLLKKTNVEGQEKKFANHIIEVQELHKDWNDKGGDIDLTNFEFTYDSLAHFDLKHNTALKAIHSQIIGSPKHGIPAMLSSKISEETGIMELSMNTRKEELSINLLEGLYENLSEYYIQKSTEKQRKTYDLVAAKTDSLQGELRSAEYSLANFMDKNRGLYNRKDQLEQFRLEAKVKMLGTAYAKVVEQKEIAEFALNDKTPVVQVIDYPISPIEPSRSSIVKKIVFALVLGGFLGAFFIIGRKIFRDTLA